MVDASPVPSRRAAGDRRSSDGRQRLLRAAERLIATRGLDVPSQEIVAAAGHRNRSAIQYHFGSREALVDAVRELHGSRIAAHRLQLIARLPGPETRTTAQLVDAYLRPFVAEMTAATPSYWARFNEMLLLDQPLRFTRDVDGPPERRPEEPAGRVVSGLFDLIEQHLTQLPPQEAQSRVALTVRFLVSSLARWEHDFEADTSCVAPLTAFSQILTDLAVAMLDVPSWVPPAVNERFIAAFERPAGAAPVSAPE